jgi:hypothetical protein
MLDGMVVASAGLGNLKEGVEIARKLEYHLSVEELRSVVAVLVAC